MSRLPNHRKENSSNSKNYFFFEKFQKKSEIFYKLFVKILSILSSYIYYYYYWYYYCYYFLKLFIVINIIILLLIIVINIKDIFQRVNISNNYLFIKESIRFTNNSTFTKWINPWYSYSNEWIHEISRKKISLNSLFPLLGSIHYFLLHSLNLLFKFCKKKMRKNLKKLENSIWFSKFFVS